MWFGDPKTSHESDIRPACVTTDNRSQEVHVHYRGVYIYGHPGPQFISIIYRSLLNTNLLPLAQAFNMDLSVSRAFAFAVVGLCVLTYRILQIGKRDPRMPKGPPTLPVLGNAHQLPTSGLYKKYAIFLVLPGVD